MATELTKAENAPSSQLSLANKRLEELNNELKLDLAQAALDIAGIVDPTPISDGLSGLMSLARGDYIGAGLSLISMIPYAGDALAKTSKGARLTAKIAALRKKIVSAIAAVDAAKKAALLAAKVINRAAKGVDNVKAAISGKIKTVCPVGVKNVPLSKAKIDEILGILHIPPKVVYTFLLKKIWYSLP